MLDTLEPPPRPAALKALEPLIRHTRSIAAQRTQSILIPDAHALRVATLSAAVARRVGFVRHEVDVVVEGALLHDVGKARVPRTILDQRRPLTEGEYATVKKHPVWGAALMDGFVSPGALAAIRHHHEWWNGGGYPSGFAGDEIPAEALIVGIADAYVAMREVRAYRPPKTWRVAVAEVER